jgi:2-polyprenyl-3-methyl-5-hydroxy-6-metoxy-1,4-benzoquinol methylase
MNILDIGVGDGGWKEIQDAFPRTRNIRSSWLYEYGGSYAYGIDIDAKSVEKSKRRINNGTQFFIMNAQDTSFSSGFFHVIHMNDVLSSVTNNYFIIKETKRILSDSGILLLKETVNNLVFLLNALPLRLLFSKSKDKIDLFQTESYLNDLRESGFKITDEEYYWYFEINGWTSLWLCGIVSRFLKIIRLDRVFCRKMVVTAIKH